MLLLTAKNNFNVVGREGFGDGCHLRWLNTVLAVCCLFVVCCLAVICHLPNHGKRKVAAHKLKPGK